MVQGVAGTEDGEVDGGPHAGSHEKGLGPIIRSVLARKEWAEGRRAQLLCFSKLSPHVINLHGLLQDFSPWSGHFMSLI